MDGLQTGSDGAVVVTETYSVHRPGLGICGPRFVSPPGPFQIRDDTRRDLGILHHTLLDAIAVHGQSLQDLVERAVRQQRPVHVPDVLRRVDQHRRSAGCGEESRRVAHPLVLEAVHLLSNLEADQSEQRPHLLGRLSGDVNRFPELDVTVVEDSDCLIDHLDTEALETGSERLAGVQPECGQGHHHGICRGVCKPVPCLNHGHRASVMLGQLRSAGLLPYRLDDELRLLVAHPGGPFFARRDNGWWSIVKGIVEADESDEEAAAREFEEETGWPAPPLPWIELGETTLKSRKIVVAYAVEADLDPETLDSNLITISGRSFPEIDRVVWMSVDQARVKLNQAQTVFIDRLIANLDDARNIVT